MGILAEALAHCPALSTHLNRILDRCDVRGELSGTLKLGDSSVPADELRALRRLFGGSLKTSMHGVHRLNLTQFLDEMADPQTWIDGLYQALGRRRQNLVKQKAVAQADYHRLLDQLRLAYPAQAAIFNLLAAAKTPSHILEKGGMKQLRDRWFALAEVVAFLQDNRTHVGLSDLGARFFNDSKTLRNGKLKSELCRWLNALETEQQCAPLDSEELLQKFGVTDNATSIKVTIFGCFRYRKNGIWHDWPCGLRKSGESATLSLDNLAGVEACEFPGNDTIITCENESPFNTLIREESLIPVVYTAGFPNAAVRLLLEKLPVATRLRHWGDSDLAGLRIARILSRIRPVSLWRCDLPELKRHRRMLKPTKSADKRTILAMLEASPDDPFAAELRFTAENGWLEQERWVALS